MKYRADIDGLRAIAVLAVVIFHLDIAGFSGGFVGVDVFFVISGFLITSIIKAGYDSESFSFSGFYARRIRRLLPPLIVTVAASVLVAAFLFTPYMMVTFARSAAAALFSLSNFVFFAESGYWDSASELKPLLHTWSLGVEEQFYLVWPALVVGLLSLQRWLSFWVALAAITVFGAALCIWYTQVNQSAAFYLLPFRVFQFSLGACLIPLCSRMSTSRDLPSVLPASCFWAGLLGIGISVFMFDESTRFPGWAVLLPTISTGLLILSGSNDAQAHRPAQVLLQNPLSLWLGRVSYSLYLAHWPVIVFYRYHFGLTLEVTDQLILALATVGATCFLHYGIERRFYRRGTKGNKKSGRAKSGYSDGRFALATIAAAGCIAIVSASAWLGNGWDWRFDSLSLSANEIKEGKKARFSESHRICHLRNLNAPKCKLDAPLQVLTLGNSLEIDGLNFMIGGYGDDPMVHLIQFGSLNQCSKLEQLPGRFVTTEPECQQKLDSLFNSKFLARIDVLVYSANKPYARNKAKFLNIIRQMKQENPGIHVVTYGGYINTERDCSYYVNDTGSTAACATDRNVTYFADTPERQPLFADIRALESHYIDRVALLCKNSVLESCLTRTVDGVPMLYDHLHSSLEFSLMTGKMYAARHPDLLRRLAKAQDK